VNDHQGQLIDILDGLADIVGLLPAPKRSTRFFGRRSSARTSPAVDRIGRLEAQMGQLSAQVIAAAARHRAWSRRHYEGQWTPAETAQHDRYRAEIDNLDQRLAAVAVELLEASATYFNQRSAVRVGSLEDVDFA